MSCPTQETGNHLLCTSSLTANQSPCLDHFSACPITTPTGKQATGISPWLLLACLTLALFQPRHIGLSKKQVRSHTPCLEAVHAFPGPAAGSQITQCPVRFFLIWTPAKNVPHPVLQIQGSSLGSFQICMLFLVSQHSFHSSSSG